MTLDELKNALAKDLSDDDRASLDAGSSHPFNCKCQVCKNWWKLCGPEEDGTYGPFTQSEILDEMPQTIQCVATVAERSN